jgi:hypothetical protein
MLIITHLLETDISSENKTVQKTIIKIIESWIEIGSDHLKVKKSIQSIIFILFKKENIFSTQIIQLLLEDELKPSVLSLFSTMITVMSSTTEDIDFFRNFFDSYVINQYLDEKEKIDIKIIERLTEDNKIYPFLIKDNLIEWIDHENPIKNKLIELKEENEKIKKIEFQNFKIISKL